MKFEVRKIRFGAQARDDDDEPDDAGLPRPLLLKLRARKAAAIAEAKEVLEYLPEPGNSTHFLATRRLDLADVIEHLLSRLGKCERLALATLGYNARNLRSMIRWLDTGAVVSLTLLASYFYRSHNGEAWQTTLEEFHKRGQKAAVAASHAKVVSFAFASGERIVIEGSGNLCGSGSAIEQWAVINSQELQQFHEKWICEKVSGFST